MTLHAVIFDMDGVLCSTDEYHYQSWKKVTKEHGISFSREVNEQLRGLTRRRSLEVILKGKLLSKAEMQVILDQKNKIFQELIQNISASELMAGVANLLDELQQAGIKIGVASASRNVQLLLARLGISGKIEAFCDGNTTRRSKPSPDVFLATAVALKIRPGECLVIEDSQAGIQAAKAAGMCVVGLGPLERVNEAHARFPDLSDVRLIDLREVYRLWEKQHSSAESYQYFSFP